jgi:hypothetical protein
VILMAAASLASVAQAGTLSVLGTGWLTSWTISWTTPGVSFNFVAGSPNTLAETVAFADNNPIAITFTENAAPTANNFGLRLTMSETITNQTGVAWTGFSEVLQDATSSPQGSAAHPSFAHFHSDSGFTGSQFPTVVGVSPTSSFAFSGGTVANGSSWTPAGIGMHEFEDSGVLRTFTLVETPTAATPEPTSLLLALLGAVVLAALYRRQHAH